MEKSAENNTQVSGIGVISWTVEHGEVGLESEILRSVLDTLD